MQIFEWDEWKAAENRRKHKVAFKDAMRVFEDEFAIAEKDREVDGEERWQTIGRAGPLVLLLVAHTVRDTGQDEVIRIISARLAEPHERRRYEQNRAQNVG